MGPDNCLSYREQRNGLGFPLLPLPRVFPSKSRFPLLSADPRHCPSREVTLSIYTDACYPIGPGTPLVSAVARLPRATCNLGVAKLTNAPTLTRDQKYWVVATTTADQSGLDANWYAFQQCSVCHQHWDWMDTN